MSVLRQLLILALIAGLAVGAWFGNLFELTADDRRPAAEAGAGAKEAAAVPVIVETARYQSSAAMVEAVGTGVAIKSVTLFPEAAGQVENVLFDAGEEVALGTALLRLDDEDEVLAVELAKVRLDATRLALQRYEQAAPSGAVSATEVDAARSDVDAAKIELSRAELALRRRTLLAPFAGVLGIPEVEEGDRITESTPVATLDDRSALLVDFEVPESLAYGVQIGQSLTATAWALPGRSFVGEVQQLASRIDPDSRTLRVRAHVLNEDDALRSGMSFVITVPLTGNMLPSVPSVSVQWNREGAFVWRVGEDGRAEKVAVDVRRRSDDWVLVEAEIAEGDRIVVEGVQRLREGTPVEIGKREVEDDGAAGGGGDDG